ncbi:hypothetical protein [Cryptosporangium phraense]|uniref:Uncharacterized protein n=1 Tax=Cryptosporangium phraense TaxID=2593070 RepID=A0A545ANC0_9ACTN|nr:hypothetical protein [Cryptosporangium phraense]TQS42773.1 hypothetical protein FL583_22170 [Cryptosporangium phraense]
MSIGDWAALAAAIAAVIIAIPAVSSSAPHRSAFIAGAVALLVLALILAMTSAFVDDGDSTPASPNPTSGNPTASPPPSTSPVETATTEPAGSPVYSDVGVGLPGGNCGAQTQIDLDPPSGTGPEVSPATNPINGAGTADLSLSNCGSLNGQVLRPNNDSRIAILDGRPPTVGACAEQLQRAPEAQGIVPRVGITICLTTEAGAVAALVVTDVQAGDNFRMEANATLWRS